MVNIGIIGRSRVHFANGGQSFAENAEFDGSGVSDILTFLLSFSVPNAPNAPLSLSPAFPN
jgi:hypothetical protein